MDDAAPLARMRHWTPHFQDYSLMQETAFSDVGLLALLRLPIVHCCGRTQTTAERRASDFLKQPDDHIDTKRRDSLEGRALERGQGGVQPQAEIDLQADRLKPRQKQILRTMLREGWASEKKVASQDYIAGLVEEDKKRKSFSHHFSALRKMGLIAATGKGTKAGTHLTPRGVEVARRLSGPTK